jgi:hypothetical protein
MRRMRGRIHGMGARMLWMRARIRRFFACIRGFCARQELVMCLEIAKARATPHGKGRPGSIRPRVRGRRSADT